MNVIENEKSVGTYILLLGFFFICACSFFKKTIEVTETLEQTEIPSRAKHGEISPWAKVAIVREAID